MIGTPRYDLTTFKVHFGRLTLKAYTKGEHVLRVEAITHNTAELRCGRVLDRYGDITARLRTMAENFCTTLDCVDVSFIPDGLLDELPQPSMIGATRVGGIDIEPRPDAQHHRRRARPGRRPLRLHRRRPRRQGADHDRPDRRRLHAPSGRLRPAQAASANNSSTGSAAPTATTSHPTPPGSSPASSPCATRSSPRSSPVSAAPATAANRPAGPPSTATTNSSASPCRSSSTTSPSTAPRPDNTLSIQRIAVFRFRPLVAPMEGVMNRPEVLKLFAQQHWVASVGQLKRAGRDAQRHRASPPARAFAAVMRGVVRSPKSRCRSRVGPLAAQLGAGAGAFVSGPTAGALHGLRQMPRHRIEVTIPQRRRATLPSWCRLVRTSWINDERDVASDPHRRAATRARCGRCSDLPSSSTSIASSGRPKTCGTNSS